MIHFGIGNEEMRPEDAEAAIKRYPARAHRSAAGERPVKPRIGKYIDPLGPDGMFGNFWYVKIGSSNLYARSFGDALRIVRGHYDPVWRMMNA